MSYPRRRREGRTLLEAPRRDPQKHYVSFCANSSRFEAQRARVCLRNGAHSSVLSGAGNFVWFRGGRETVREARAPHWCSQTDAAEVRQEVIELPADLYGLNKSMIQRK